ncbi:MAG: acetoin utilization protein AcuC [Leptospirales bacterium]
MHDPVDVYLGEELAAYGFPDSHPFSTLRHDAFSKKFYNDSLDSKCNILTPVLATKDEIALFHTPKYIQLVEEKSITGSGYLDRGDTPAFIGAFKTTSYVVGSALHAAKSILQNGNKAAFVPIAGLHHARRSIASGFCIFNDCGVVIEYLLQQGLNKIAYIDIDAHHGDGVYYDFEDNPKVIFADIHESGRTLFPGTGYSKENGKGEAVGKKLNIEMQPEAGDEAFFEAWSQVETFIDSEKPEFILMQCGADSVLGDPLTHLRYSANAHGQAAKSLRELSRTHSSGRMLAVGGGGYNLDNIAAAWTAVVKSLF